MNIRLELMVQRLERKRKSSFGQCVQDFVFVILSGKSTCRVVFGLFLLVPNNLCLLCWSPNGLIGFGVCVVFDKNDLHFPALPGPIALPFLALLCTSLSLLLLLSVAFQLQNPSSVLVQFVAVVQLDGLEQSVEIFLKWKILKLII